MSKKREETRMDQQLLNVFVYNNSKLNKIEAQHTSNDEKIESYKEVLSKYGYEVGNIANERTTEPVKLAELSSEELFDKVESETGYNSTIDDLFTKEELEQQQNYVDSLYKEFNELHKLDTIDYVLSISAGILASCLKIMSVGIPTRTKEGLQAGMLENYIREHFTKIYPIEEMQKLANSTDSKVPFDAQDNRNTSEYVVGLSAYYHRLLTLGHDPVLGFVVGVIDIMTGRMTAIDKAGNITSQAMTNYSDRVEKNLFRAIIKEYRHLISDLNTSMGLPAPFMGLFNLLQFGSIGEEEQTIAEIVQGMYYEGFDFIHFCTLSITEKVIEIVVRLGYAIKRIKEGNGILKSIPFSKDRDKHPKLTTMLFIAHSVSAGINAGEILFKKNPMLINPSEWTKFIKSAYHQINWTLKNKPKEREKYINGRINEQLESIIKSINKSFCIC